MDHSHHRNFHSTKPVFGLLMFCLGVMVFAGATHASPNACPDSTQDTDSFNSLILADAAKYCDEAGHREMAIELIILSHLRFMLDLSMFEVDLVQGTEHIQRIDVELSEVFEHFFGESLRQDPEGLLHSFERIVHWQPRLPNDYDPGWPTPSSLEHDEYQDEFMRTRARAYAAMVPAVQLHQSEEGAARLREVETTSAKLIEPLDRFVVSEFEDASAALERHERRLAMQRHSYYSPDFIVGEIEESGIFATEGRREVLDADDTSDGIAFTYSQFVHLEHTRTVPAEIGLSFGFNYLIHGIIDSTLDHVRMRLIHPPLINWKGEIQTVSEVAVSEPSWGNWLSGHASYQFTQDYQLHPGTWTLQIVVSDYVVISQDFDVVEVE